MGQGEATSAAPSPPGRRRGEAGNEGLWGHMELPTPPKAGHPQWQSPQGMLPTTKVWERQWSLRGRKQEGHNLGLPSSFSEAQAAAEGTRSKHIPGHGNNADLI